MEINSKGISVQYIRVFTRVSHYPTIILVWYCSIDQDPVVLGAVQILHKIKIYSISALESL